MAGEITVRPNAFQRLVHRLLMLRPVSAFLARVLYRVDSFLLNHTVGKYTITQLVGLPIIMLTAKGAKTGQLRTLPLLSLIDGDKIAIVGSNFGRKNNPGWYYNLKANPECTVQFNGRTATYKAREVVGPERERYWQLAVSYYKGYEAYKIRAAHRKIPIMVLELSKTLS